MIECDGNGAVTTARMCDLIYSLSGLTRLNYLGFWVEK